MCRNTFLVKFTVLYGCTKQNLFPSTEYDFGKIVVELGESDNAVLWRKLHTTLVEEIQVFLYDVQFVDNRNLQNK